MSGRKMPVSNTRAPGSGIPPYKPTTKVTTKASLAMKSVDKTAKDREQNKTAVSSGRSGVPAVAVGKKGESPQVHAVMSNPSGAPGDPCRELSGVPYSGNGAELESPALAVANKRIFELSQELEMEKQCKVKLMEQCAALKVAKRNQELDIAKLDEERLDAVKAADSLKKEIRNPSGAAGVPCQKLSGVPYCGDGQKLEVKRLPRDIVVERAKAMEKQVQLMRKRDHVEGRADELERKLRGRHDASRAKLGEERPDAVKAADSPIKQPTKNQHQMTNKQVRALELAQQMKKALFGSGGK